MQPFLTTLEQAIKANWDKKAVCDYNGAQYTFGEFARQIEELHIAFSEAGIRQGDHIALYSKNSARWAVSYFAIVSYGAVAVLILADFTPDAATNLINHSESRILFTDEDLWGKIDPSSLTALAGAIQVSTLSPLWSKDSKLENIHSSLSDLFEKKYPYGYGRENVHYEAANNTGLCVINYTSGTTSSPKGVMISYGNLNYMVDFCLYFFPTRKEDQMVSILPLAHMYGLVIEMMYPIIGGVTMYFLGKTPSPTLLMNAMKEVRPYLITAVPMVMEKIYKKSVKPALGKVKGLLWIPFIGSAIYKKAGKSLMQAFGGNVRMIILGGAALNPEAEHCFKRMGIPYTVGYGMTEASPLLAYSNPKEYVAGSCGKAVQTVRIDSEDPRHIAGEIQACGANICMGYFNNPEASANAFTEDGYLRTGDLGVFDSNGNIFIKGRCKTMILSASGQNIYPEELEAVINNCSYIAESVVVDRAGRLVALLYLDQEAIRKAHLSAEEVADIPETTRLAVNKIFPLYSQIAKVEVVVEPFAKTPKMSIKRFLYK